ncbi:MAG: hypothetical protein KIH63_005770 [Candidatus Saccharibacteria bacterium]|nr:hypothetical protein [Candidatus Saccharibacteria bacterium]
MHDSKIVSELLRTYGIVANVDAKEITEFRAFKSHIFGMQSVYRFTYKGKRYYATDDYSLMDNPDYVREVLEEFQPNLKGRLVKNPIPQSDGAIYATGTDGREYYLWSA